MSELPYSKVIDISDFEHPALLPYLEEVSRGERAAFGVTDPIIVPDSKQWECAMMIRALADAGVLKEGAMLAGIGAGTEETSFTLANRGCVVFPIDRYLELTPWSDVAPAGMMAAPDQYGTIDRAAGAIIPVHGDARSLRLPSNFFDGVYSAGSIEHFGSIAAVQAAAEEIGRVLKPGGVAVLSTEFRLEGPNDKRWFSDDCILFSPEMLQQHIIGASGLELLGNPCWSLSEATYDCRVVLAEFLDKAKSVKTLEDKRRAYPNLVLFHEGFLFCSVHLALRKPAGTLSTEKGPHAQRFDAQVAADLARTSEVLSMQIAEWSNTYRSAIPADTPPLIVAPDPQLGSIIAHYERHIQMIEASRSMRLTRPMRQFADFVRRTPALNSAARLGIRAVRGAARRIRQAVAGR